MTKRRLSNRLAAGNLCAAASIAVMSLAPQSGSANNSNDFDTRIQRGLEIAPVRLDYARRDRALVGLGSYLVNAMGGCNDCHTSPSYTKDPYTVGVVNKEVNKAGYLAGGAQFGPFTSRNLTPDKSGKPFGASYAEFRLIMRTGIDLDQWPLNLPAPANGKVLQVMPWPVYQDMTELDLRAMYEYLSAIPCVEGDPGNPAGADTMGHRCK